jgi:pimeloyl-ACP methyl ester carboxylesterase
MPSYLSPDLSLRSYIADLPPQDLRNHGSSPHTPRHTYPLLAADLSAFITNHRLKTPTLIGHSMGAKAVMTLALREPERIANLIAVDNAPVDAMLKSDFGTYVRGMKEVERVGVSRQSEADEILEKYVKVSRIAKCGVIGDIFGEEMEC